MGNSLRWPRSLKPFLFPMLLLSIAAHGAVLFFVPIPEVQPEENVATEPLPEDAETIEVVRLPKPPQPQSEGRSESEEIPEAQPKQQPQPAPTQAAKAPTPLDSQPETQGRTDDRPDNSDDSNYSDTNDQINGDDDREPTLAEKLEDIGYYQYSEAGTSQVEAIAYLGGWTDELKNAGLGYEKSDPENIKIPYLLTGCLNNPPSEYASLGVIVAASGDIEGEPEILGSTGYSLLDQFALEKIRTEFSFPNASERKAYLVGIEVENYADQCPTP
ncbi:MAG: hypothetical protein AAF728_06715 [Cyanobacteria bacterium P01_D01_bin.128]